MVATTRSELLQEPVEQTLVRESRCAPDRVSPLVCRSTGLPTAERFATGDDARTRNPFHQRVEDDAQAIATEFLAGFCGHTYTAYLADLTGFFGYCASIGVDPLDATRGQVAGYLQHLSGLGRRPATIARRLVVLRGYYNLAVDEYGLAVSPVTRIRYRRFRDQTRLRALTGEQLVAFLQTADQATPRITGLAWLLATTGIRVSEGCAAQTRDLRPGGEPGEWWLDVACKGSLRRTVPLHAATWQRLQPLSTADADHIFTTGDGRELDRHTAARDLARVAVRAEIPGRFSPHVLRHTFVTLARQAGCPLEDVQDAVGHADPATTRRYDRTLLQQPDHPGARILATLNGLRSQAVPT